MKEEMEKDLKAQLLKEWEGHPACRLFLAHLEELCKRKEVEKALALRGNRLHDAVLRQGEIDGINLTVKSLNNLTTRLTPQSEV